MKADWSFAQVVAVVSGARRYRRRAARWIVVGIPLILAVQLGAVGFPLPILGTGPAAAANPSAPVPPPAAMNPAPSVQQVTTSGPTQAPAQITTDTVWGPQGSPYVVTGSVTIANKASLTLLPGTVVKLDMGGRLGVQTGGQILSLGTPGLHVVVTSLRDDSVLGDTNADGSGTAPARGDWNTIQIEGGPAGSASRENPTSVFDYTDLKYGGAPTSTSFCSTYGEISTVRGPVVRLVISNSSFTDSIAAGVTVDQATDPRGRVGIYNSTFARSGCGFGDVGGGGQVDIVGNTFAGPFDNDALMVLGDHQNTRAWFNTIQGGIDIAGATVALTRAQADLRYNALLGGIGGIGERYELTDWSSNWYGRDANQALPTCLDPAAAIAFYPPVLTVANSPSCPSGQVKVSSYKQSVTPALSGSPQVLPASLREAAAPTFGPVNTYTGALTYQADDMTVQDAGKQIGFARTYRSDKPGTGDTGTGWSTSYAESMSQTGGVATLKFGNSQSVDFSTDPAAGYTPAPGVSAGYNPGSTGTTVTSPNQSSYQFDPSGQLTSETIGDDGHQVNIQRSGGQVTRVSGVSGRYLSYARGGGKINGVTDSTGRGVTYTYSGGRLSSVTNVDGQIETYGYDSDGRLSSVTTPMGRAKLRASYNSDGRVAWVEENGNGRTTYAYDDANHRRTITTADGTVTVQEYDFAGRLVSERTGTTGSHVVYDGEGHTVATINGVPNSPMTGYGPAAPATFFDKNGDPALAVDAMGIGTGTTFNSRHQPLLDTRTDDTTVNRTYDDHFRLTQLTDPAGQTWQYTYNSWGEVTSQADPLTRTRTIGYATNGDPTSITDETGAATTFGFDPQGRRTTITDPLGNQKHTAYTASDRVSQTTQPRGGATAIEFNADGQQTRITDAVGGVTTYEYDSAGRLSATADPVGGRTTSSYDVLGRPTSSTDPRGSVTRKSYLPEGWVATTTDADVNITTYAYDPSGRAVRVTDPLSQVTQTAYNRGGQVTDTWTPDGGHALRSYDVMGRPRTTTTALGNVTTIGYDANGRQTTSKDPLNNISQVTYDLAGRLTGRTDRAGVTTSYAYDDSHRTVTATDPLGTLEIATRDAAGRIVSHADGAGIVTTYAYDADGDQTGVTTPAGTATTEYDLAGRVSATVDPVGRRTTTARDPLGRPTSHTYADATTDTDVYDGDGNVTSHTDRTGARWTATYDPNNLTLTATDPLLHSTSANYDPLNRRTSVTDPAGVAAFTAYDPVGRVAVQWDATNASWVTAYDLDGNVATTTDPDGVTVTYTYDKLDQPTTIDRSPSQHWRYTYDADGRLTKQSQGSTTAFEYDARGRTTAQVDGLAATDGVSNRTTVTYDGAGHQTSMTTSGGHTTAWSYDAAGRLASATDPLGDQASYGYDAADELTSERLPNGGTYTFSYDSAARMSAQTDPLGAVTRFGYNGNGDLTSTAYPSGRVVSAAFDQAGRQSSVSSGGTSRNFTYDDGGRLTAATVSGGGSGIPSLSYGYDNRGLLTQSTDSFGTTGYAYDLAGRLTTRTPSAGVATTYTYNNLGQLATVRGPTNINYTYNLAGQVSSKALVAPSRSATFAQQYDSAGRPTHVSDVGYSAALTYTADGQIGSVTEGSKVTAYTYDDAGRLSTNTVTTSGTQVSSANYTWDSDSNRASVSTNGQTPVTATFDAADRQTGSSDATVYTYDADGNQTSRGPVGYAYDSFGQLSSTTVSGTTANYARDALGRLATRTVASGTESFGYDGVTNDLAADQQGTAAVTNLVRTPDGQLIAQATVGSTNKVVGLNVHGDLVTVKDDTATTVRYQTSYDSFGKPTSTTGTATVSLGYQGQYTDPLSNLVDMGARSYDPSSGRFTSLDTVVGALNQPATLDRYAYANGDPIDNVDPGGHYAEGKKLVDHSQGSSGASGPPPPPAAATSSGTTDASSTSSHGIRKGVHHTDDDLKKAIGDVGDQFLGISAGFLVGGAVGTACEVFTSGFVTPLCMGLGGAVGGGITAYFTCPSGTDRWECSKKGAISGGVAGLAFGLGGEFGLGPILSGCLSGMAGAATSAHLDGGSASGDDLGNACGMGAIMGAIFKGRGDEPAPSVRGGSGAKPGVDDPVASPGGKPAGRGPSTDPDTNPASVGKAPTEDPAGDVPTGGKPQDEPSASNDDAAGGCKQSCTGGRDTNGKLHSTKCTCANGGKPRIVTNEHGRKGGSAHQAMVDRVEQDLQNQGFTTQREVPFKTPGGFKPNRAADVGAYDSNGNLVSLHQIGLQTKGGIPVIRETEGMSDIWSVVEDGVDIIFHAYGTVK